MNITITGTVDEIIAFAETLKKGRFDLYEVTPDERALIITSGIIVAIKEYRARTGRTLKDSKDVLEATPEGQAYVRKLRSR